MKRVLVIGAGNFGRHLVFELIRSGFAVDVVDKEAEPQYALRGSGCRCLACNAWNISASPQLLPIPEYECCYLCLSGNLALEQHVVACLRESGARRIVVRVKQPRNTKFFLRLGADQVVCPVQLASQVLAQQLVQGQ